MMGGMVEVGEAPTSPNIFQETGTGGSPGASGSTPSAAAWMDWASMSAQYGSMAYGWGAYMGMPPFYSMPPVAAPTSSLEAPGARPAGKQADDPSTPVSPASNGGVSTVQVTSKSGSAASGSQVESKDNKGHQVGQPLSLKAGPQPVPGDAVKDASPPPAAHSTKSVATSGPLVGLAPQPKPLPQATGSAAPINGEAAAGMPIPVKCESNPAEAVPSQSTGVPVGASMGPSTACTASSRGRKGTEEPEAKRNKRRQSNRESAHRSRLRKQAEVADAFIRAHSLAQENSGLRCSLSMMRVAVEQLVHDKGVLIDAVKALGGQLPEGIEDLPVVPPAGSGEVDVLQ